MLSVKVENVVPGRWIGSFSCCCGQILFTAPRLMSSTRIIRTSLFRNIFYPTVGNVFLALHHTHQCFFVHSSLFFEARLKPIAASATWIPKSTTLEYLPCLYTRAHGESSAISLTFTTATFAMKIAYPGCANARAHTAAAQRIKLRGSDAPDFFNSSTSAKPRIRGQTQQNITHSSKRA